MKQYIKNLSYALGAVVLLSTAGCTDDFEEVNTNPNKVYEVELGDVWGGTVKRSMDFVSEVNFNRLFNFSRSVVVQAFTNAQQETGSGYYRTFYIEIMRDLVQLERRYSEDPQLNANRLAIVKTWKSYMYYMMASLYGPIPMSEAINDGSDNKRTYNYDSEKEIYTQILNDLTDAYRLYESADNTSAKLDRDPVFGDGNSADMDKWKRFCNSLRLNIAMHVQNLDPELSRTMALEALDCDLIESNSGNVAPKYGTTLELSHSWYYNRCIYNRTSFSKSTYPGMGEYFYLYLKALDDPRTGKYFTKSNELAAGAEKLYIYNDTITREHKCYNRDGADYKKCPDYAAHQKNKEYKFFRDSIVVELTSVFVPLSELAQMPTGWDWAVKPGDANNTRYTDPLYKYNSEYNPSFVRTEFLDEQSTVMLLNYADVCFLKAEAELLYRSNSSAAKAAYEEGIRASMSQYGVSDYADYMKHPGVAWGTDCVGPHDRRMLYQATITGSNGNDGLLEQIYKQRYIADFFIPLEQWNVERRTRSFDFPPFFLQGSSPDIEGASLTYNFWTERLIYPNDEYIKNRDGVNTGITKLIAASPFTRPERNGDNVFTSLGIAKKQPDIDNAEKIWGTHREVTPKLEYYLGQWGTTYDDVLQAAKSYTGQTVNTVALTGIGYKWISTKGTYDTRESNN